MMKELQSLACNHWGFKVYKNMFLFGFVKLKRQQIHITVNTGDLRS
jgi:hypothetical protein